MATGTARRPPRRLSKGDLSKLLDGGGERLMHLDLVGTAEAADLLGVERARIGKWRKKGIVLGDGTRIEFPEPIRMHTTCAEEKRCPNGHLYPVTEKACPECGATGQHEVVLDHSKLAATPLWWGDDIVALKRKIERNRPRD